MFQTCQGVLAPCAPNTSAAVEIVAWAARAASLRCTSPGSIGKNTAAARRPAIRTAARACALGARCTPAHVALFAHLVEAAAVRAAGAAADAAADAVVRAAPHAVPRAVARVVARAGS